MTASLRRLQQLPGAIDVFPGHGPKTTMERENRTNPYLRHPVSHI
jgi:glyoxylase-like metal-dependent hydrolase (beta-lactamase superfamily II)